MLTRMHISLCPFKSHDLSIMIMWPEKSHDLSIMIMWPEKSHDLSIMIMWPVKSHDLSIMTMWPTKSHDLHYDHVMHKHDLGGHLQGRMSLPGNEGEHMAKWLGHWTRSKGLEFTSHTHTWLCVEVLSNLLIPHYPCFPNTDRYLVEQE